MKFHNPSNVLSYRSGSYEIFNISPFVVFFRLARVMIQLSAVSYKLITRFLNKLGCTPSVTSLLDAVAHGGNPQDRAASLTNALPLSFI
ncbi:MULTISPECIES: hypothetical protein [unclassified Moorena]|uniref:hypothetical protein n=1 Tax=unclassified Moorena TaxID=2683338 RepID=UPI0013C1A1D6|nr:MULTISPECIES: hypothetical protein [unclassified Moorena]NEQ13277.1 hypothetical protein [Moorena sp. SIO3E2]NES41342.1 hypothetical protein [Moorena sp. SIO2C4]NES85820.1 hypothetical protein [Moorena sp. SIO2B7]NET66803.1 hypothetical protein [Moorena sp. SIO1G6]